MNRDDNVDNVSPEFRNLLVKVEDTAWVSDREYFKASPQQRYRIRPAYDAEIIAFASYEGGQVCAPEKLRDGDCWWVIVRAIAPGVRMRFPFPCFHNMHPDPPEKVCKKIYREICRRVPKMRELNDKFERGIRQQLKQTGKR